MKPSIHRHLLLWLILWWLLCFLQAAVSLIILSFSGLVGAFLRTDFSSDIPFVLPKRSMPSISG